MLIDIYEYEVDEVVDFLNKHLVRSKNGYVLGFKQHLNAPVGSLIRKYLNYDVYNCHNFNQWLSREERRALGPCNKVIKQDISYLGIMFSYDWKMRKMMNVTDDTKNLKLEKLKEEYCRVCEKEIVIGMGRINDYCVIRDNNCLGPTCLKCSQDKPDVFHKKFTNAKLALENEQEIINKTRNILEKTKEIINLK